MFSFPVAFICSSPPNNAAVPCQPTAGPLASARRCHSSGLVTFPHSRDVLIPHSFLFTLCCSPNTKPRCICLIIEFQPGKKMMAQLRSVSREQSPADTRRDSSGDSRAPRACAPSGTEPLSPCSAAQIPPHGTDRPNLTSPARLAEQEQQPPTC